MLVQDGELKRGAGDAEGAIADFTQAMALDPKCVAAYYDRGQARAARGEWDAATADFSQVTALQPGNAQAYSRRGAARQNKGDLTGAAKDYDTAVSLNGNDDIAYFNRGVVAEMQGDPGAAYNGFTRAINLNPSEPDYYEHRAEIETKRAGSNDGEAALADWNKVVGLRPDAAAPRFHRGEIKEAMGDADGAIDDFTMAATMDPAYAHRVELGVILTRRAEARYQAGDDDGAVSDYDRAGAVDPTLLHSQAAADVYADRGDYRYDGGDLAGAIADYSKAINCAPAQYQLYYDAGGRAMISMTMPGRWPTITRPSNSSPILRRRTTTGRGRRSICSSWTRRWPITARRLS